MVDWKELGAGFKDYLARNLAFLGFVLAFLGGLVVAEADIPQAGKVFYVTTILGAIIMYPFAKRLVNYLYNPQKIYLLSLRAEGENLSLYEFHPNQFEKLRVKENSLDQYKSKFGPVYVARKYDRENNLAWGTWKGSLNDLELLEAEEKIKEVRGSLEKEAKNGFKARLQLSTLVRSSINRILGEFASKIEKDTIYKGDQIDEVINDVLREKDLQLREKEAEEKDLEEDQSDIWEDLARGLVKKENNGEPKEAVKNE